MHSRLLLLLALSGLAVSTGLSACSGSKSGISPSSNSPDGGADGSSVHFGSSGSFGSGSGAGSSSGAGGSSGTGTGSSAGGAAACMAPSTVPSSELLPYATVQQQLNACTSMQISAFISACVPPSGSPSKCQNWVPPNTKCAECIMPTNDAGVGQNTGAGLFDVHGNLVDYNFGGCIALIDATSSGLACAQALDTYVQCIDFACEACADQTSTDQCQSAATKGGACSGYNDAYHAPCKTDLAVDGGGTTKCSTGSQTINVICGTGM